MRLRLREIRKAKGLTQRQVAEKAGISVSYYTELENGKKQINANRMSGVAKALGVDVQDIIAAPGRDAEAALIQRLGLLDEDQRALVQRMIDTLLEAHRHKR